MSIYTVILFLHVVGAIGYFLGIGLWLFILLGLRRTQRVEQVRSLIHLTDLSAPFSGASAVLLLGTGLYLALSAWSLLTSWILVALISLLLGLVFLTTTKPNLVGSLIVMMLALLLGLAAGALVSRMRRVHEPEMVDQRVQDKEPISSRSGESVQE